MSEQSESIRSSGLCPSCFAPVGGATVCPVCGYLQAGVSDRDWNRLKPGTIIHGRYVIGRVLGQGGFGITYLGLDLRLNTKLAIKEYYPSGLAVRNTASRAVMNATVDAREDFQRGMEKFLEEARTLARFEDHPNIVSVRDFFEENGTAYMVMTYFEGRTMLRYLEEKGGTLPFEEALGILSPVMDALDEVHASGLIHRDISPDNVFITQSGQVKLLDFGAAKSAMALVNQQSHSIVLKKGYSPAEQYQSRGSLGPWTDIYSMAATIYRSIAGTTPPDSLDRLEEDILVPPSQMGVAIPDYAEAALLRALSVSPRQRPQSMREFQEALLGQADSPAPAADTLALSSAPRTVIRGTPVATVKQKGEMVAPAGKIAASPKSAAYSAAPAKKPFPVAIVAAVAVVVAIGIGGFILMGGGRGKPVANSEATSQTVVVEAAATAQNSLDTLRQKAEGGDPVSQYRLGVMFQQGKGVPRNPSIAAEWFRKSAKQGYAPAQNDLGFFYVQGVGVPQDYKEGAKWLAKAAEQGNPFAQANLGWMYDTGQGVAEDKTKAVKLYQAAAAQGNANAQTNLAYMYENGQGIERNLKKAAEYYLKAAEQGVSNAQYAIGLYYEAGVGVPKDRAKAIQWLKKAADQGDQGAIDKLKSMGVAGSSS